MTFLELLKDKIPELTIHTRVDLFEREMAEVVALHLYSQGKITSGTAAKLIGISRVSFLQLAGTHEIPMFEYTEEELSHELQEI